MPPDRIILAPVRFNQDHTVVVQSSSYTRTLEYMVAMDNWADLVLKKEALCNE